MAANTGIARVVVKSGTGSDGRLRCEEDLRPRRLYTK